MPVISMFYGIIVCLYFEDDQQHSRPHIHARYQEDEVVLGVPEGDVIDGRMPQAKLRLVQAWIEIHRDELMADWQLAVSGQHPYKIEPLK